MDTNTLFKKLRELGHANNKRKKLEEFCVQHFQQITKLLPQRILNNDGPDILDCLLNGLPDHSSDSSHFKSKVIDIVFTLFRNELTSITHCNDSISRACLELSRCPVDDIIRWSTDCVQSIVEDKDANMIWRDVLPECFYSLTSHNTVKHHDVDITSEEYKQKCITTLCHCNWKETQLVQLAAMFIDMKLSQNDHKEVVIKICSYLNDIPPESLPPLVHQLLKLCKTLDIDIVLVYLSEYFNLKLYSKFQPSKSDSDSATTFADDIAPNCEKELTECMSTCLYHLIQGPVYPDFLIKRLKLWPTSQVLRNPLLVNIALALSEKGADFKKSCISIIKDAIEQRELDDIKVKESAWVREVLSSDVDVPSVLKLLTNESTSYCQNTLIGLINLAFALLAVAKSKPGATNCWSHGRLILVRVCKGKSSSINHILMQLGDKDLTLKPYSDCFQLLCKLVPGTVERCSYISSFLENVQPQNNEYRPAAKIFQAIHPLLNFSIKVRDSMVMLCRKLLYSRESYYRCLALSGFLVLLRYVKISNTSSASQIIQEDQYSAHSYLSHLTLELHATQNGEPVRSGFRNESILLEVLTIIKRCLVLDAAVKQLLYADLYKCVDTKTTLHEPVLETYYEHIFKYISEDGSPPILWDKCVQITSNNAVLIEPIGYLIYSISHFLKIDNDEDDDDIMCSQFEPGSIHLKRKLIDILDNLVKSDLITDTALESDQISLTTPSPESTAKYLKLQQILQCYEALIAYKILLWTTISDDTHNIILKLYKSYNQLLELVKAPKSKKTLKTTQSDVSKKTTQSSAKDNDSTTKTKTKDKMAPFKPLPCLWNLEFCLKVIELLYSEHITWCMPEHRNVIRTNREFHMFALRRVQSIVNDEILEKEDVITHGIRITQVLYKRCLVGFQDICNFDEKTALACIELLKEFINLLLSKNYAFKVKKVMCDITGDNTLSECLAAILEVTHAALTSLHHDPDTTEVDAGSRKMYMTLCQLAARVMTVPLVDSCPKLTSIITEYETFVRKTSNDTSALLPALLCVSARNSQDSDFIDDLLATLSSVLGLIGEETQAEDEEHPFPSLDERTGLVALSQLCSHVSVIHQNIALQFAHAKQKHAALQATTVTSAKKIEKDLKQLKRSLVIQLCQLTKWMNVLGMLRCVIGSGSDKILLAFIKLYSLLGDFVKLLSLSVNPNEIQVLHNIRFDRLMKLSGKPLSQTMDHFIEYIVKTQSNNIRPSEVLKDTKHIPKLVLEAEQFKNLVLKLSKKTKINYEEYMPLGTARDFKIKEPLLLRMLQNDIEDISDAESVILQPRRSEGSPGARSDDEQNVEPEPKKRRV